MRKATGLILCAMLSAAIICLSGNYMINVLIHLVIGLFIGWYYSEMPGRFFISVFAFYLVLNSILFLLPGDKVYLIDHIGKTAGISPFVISSGIIAYNTLYTIACLYIGYTITVRRKKELPS